jgi:predicted Zn-dependent protease
MTVQSGQDIAESLLGKVRAVARGAEAEVRVTRTSLALTRFANSAIHQNVADHSVHVSLRVHVDGRTASVSASRPDAFDRLIDEAVSAARLLPEDAHWAGVAPPATLHAAGNYDEDTAHAVPMDRADVVRQFVAAAGSLTSAGFCQTTSTEVTFADTAGQQVEARVTSAVVDGIASAGMSGGQRADGVARRAAVRLADLDGAELGVIAATKSRAAVGPEELPPGRYEVVLEPSAVRDVLILLGVYGFNGRAVNEGRSFLRPGEPQFDTALTLVDDATAPDAIGLPFDAEGTPKAATPLITAGISGDPVHDRRTAKETGATSTGHALAGGEQFGAMPTQLYLRPGSGGRTDELVAGVERGLLISDFWYTRVLDPRTVVVTGLTRNGLWLIEDGAVTRPVTNLRFTQAYPEAMGPGSVLGVGSATESVPFEWETGAISAPALRLASWNMTGGASR